MAYTVHVLPISSHVVLNIHVRPNHRAFASLPFLSEALTSSVTHPCLGRLIIQQSHQPPHPGMHTEEPRMSPVSQVSIRHQLCTWGQSPAGVRTPAAQLCFSTLAVT
jgi:hypothetical protein